MKALEIAEKARDAILSGKFDQVGNCFVGAQMTVCLYKMLLKIFITLLGTCQPAEW
jgi:hypothetical protein